MQDNQQYDIWACLKDIEQSIIEIYEFLPEESNFFTFQKDLKHEKLLSEISRLLEKLWTGY